MLFIMNLRFTNHATYRIFYERNISADKIKMTIAKPDSSEKLQNNLIKSKKVLDKKRLVVVYSRNKRGEYVIITAYFQ